MSIRYALNIEGETITPEYSGQRAICPECKSPVVAHCGSIVVWHWQHLSGRDCDPWYEPITEWHVSWQEYLKVNKGAEIEVSITKNGKTHRADAVSPSGKVIELQHSAISPEEMRKREEFYGKKMIWIFDAREVHKKHRIKFSRWLGKHTFHWKQARKSIAYAERKVFLDLGKGQLFKITDMTKDAPYCGYGREYYCKWLDWWM